jgi:hypothetical protein
MEKLCPYSGEVFQSKRKDQIFANAVNRRNYHNQLLSEKRRQKASIDKVLDKNFTVLSEILKDSDSATITKQMLASKGYEIMVFTHLDKGKDDFIICLYHFQIHKTGDENLYLITKTPSNGRPN